MTGQPEEESQPSEIKVQVQRWTRRMLELLAERAAETGLGPAQLVEISNQIGRQQLVVDLLFALAPEAANADLWVDWLTGGKSPQRDIRTQKFDPDPGPSGRKIKAAQREADRASARTVQARERLSAVRKDLEQAEQELQRAEEEEKLSRDLARGVAGWALLSEVARVSSGVFSMGPAWTLMRVMSAHFSGDETTAASGPEPLRSLVAEHIEQRQERSVIMLDMLNDRAGDIDFEVQLFDHLWGFFEIDLGGYEPARSQARRNMKNGVGKKVERGNIHKVAAGVRRSPN